MKHKQNRPAESGDSNGSGKQHTQCARCFSGRASDGRRVHVGEERLLLELADRGEVELVTVAGEKALGLALEPRREDLPLPLDRLAEGQLAGLRDRDREGETVLGRDVREERVVHARGHDLRDAREVVAVRGLVQRDGLEAAVPEDALHDRVLLALERPDGVDLAGLGVDSEDVVGVAALLALEPRPAAADEGERDLVRPHEEEVRDETAGLLVGERPEAVDEGRERVALTHVLGELRVARHEHLLADAVDPADHDVVLVEVELGRPGHVAPHDLVRDHLHVQLGLAPGHLDGDAGDLLGHAAGEELHRVVDRGGAVENDIVHVFHFRGFRIICGAA